MSEQDAKKAVEEDADRRQGKAEEETPEVEGHFARTGPSADEADRRSKAAKKR
jgi:hypothetical protein